MTLELVHINKYYLKDNVIAVHLTNGDVIKIEITDNCLKLKEVSKNNRTYKNKKTLSKYIKFMSSIRRIYYTKLIKQL